MAERMSTEIQKSLNLLDKLTTHKPPLLPLGELNPKLLVGCRAVFFYHTTKVGLGVGVKWGHGLLVAKASKDEDNTSGWTRPVLFKVQEASLGMTAGVGTAETMLLLGDNGALDKFRGKSSVVLGTDFKVVAISDLGLGTQENAGALKGSGGITTALTLADGILVDLSVVGGTVSFDAAANHEVYGPDATAEQLLSSKLPNSTEGTSGSLPDVSRLHEALNEIQAAAHEDPRDFKGFTKRWKPQNPFQTDFPMHQGVDAQGVGK